MQAELADAATAQETSTDVLASRMHSNIAAAYIELAREAKSGALQVSEGDGAMRRIVIQELLEEAVEHNLPGREVVFVQKVEHSA